MLIRVVCLIPDHFHVIELPMDVRPEDVKSFFEGQN